MGGHRGWIEELYRALALLGAALAAGWGFGQLGLWLVIALLAYPAWVLVDLGRVSRWLDAPEDNPPPDLRGASGRVVQVVYQRLNRLRARIDELTQTMMQLRSSAHALPDAVVALDAGLRIQWANRAAERDLGIRTSVDAGQHVDNLLRHPDFLRYRRRGALSEPITIPGPLDPERQLRLTLVRHSDAQYLLIAHDQTERLRAERIRRDFVSNVSHELKTPLSVLCGYVETMQAAERTPTRWRKPLTAMEHQVRRMSGLVADLLLLSHIESVDRPIAVETVAVGTIAAMLAEAARLLGGARAHRIEVEAEAALALRGSESELYAAFSNLVTNAVQHTPDGGSIRIAWFADNVGACFEVTDTGDGIDPAHIPRLTERFYRIDSGRSRAEGGTGLGLAIVKHVLEHHRARLEVRSTPGKGSRFACRFPADLVVHSPPAVPAVGRGGRAAAIRAPAERSTNRSTPHGRRPRSPG